MSLSSSQPSPPHSWARQVFVIAGWANIVAILLATRAFTDSTISQVDPEGFSTPSLVLIMIWGTAYLAVAPRWQRLPQMCLVFAVEKLVYVVMWTQWIRHHRDQLDGVWEEDPLIALFYGGYGIVDLGFGCFFFWAWLQARQTSPDSPTPDEE